MNYISHSKQKEKKEQMLLQTYAICEEQANFIDQLLATNNEIIKYQQNEIQQLKEDCKDKDKNIFHLNEALKIIDNYVNIL